MRWGAAGVGPRIWVVGFFDGHQPGPAALCIHGCPLPFPHPRTHLVCIPTLLFACPTDDVGKDVPRLLINRHPVGLSPAAKAMQQQEEERQQRQLSSSASSDVSSVEGDDRSCDGAWDGSSSGDDSSSGSDSGEGSGADEGSAEEARGFNFRLPGNRRDALHLGDADAAVRQLAALLGWGEELERVIEEDAKARAEAAEDWD